MTTMGNIRIELDGVAGNHAIALDAAEVGILLHGEPGTEPQPVTPDELRPLIDLHQQITLTLSGSIMAITWSTNAPGNEPPPGEADAGGPPDEGTPDEGGPA